jgi:hypothetical protein
MALEVVRRHNGRGVLLRHGSLSHTVQTHSCLRDVAIWNQSVHDP